MDDPDLIQTFDAEADREPTPGDNTETATARQPVRAGGQSRPTEILPTPRIAFSNQLNLLVAYAAIYDQTGRPVTNEAAGEVADLSAGTTSLANAFFAEVGFLSRAEGGYIPSREVISYRRARDWTPKDAERELGPLVATSWFAEALLPRLSLGPMTEQAALVELGKRASAGVQYRPQLKMLLDYLTTTGVLVQDGDLLRRALPESSGAGARDEAPSAEADFTPSPPPKTGLHPFIVGLLDTLPDVGTEWPDAKRRDWIQAAEAVFNMIYERPSSDSEPYVRITPSGSET